MLQVLRTPHTIYGSAKRRGFVMMVAIFALATLSAIIAASVNRSMTSSRLNQDAKATLNEQLVRRSILNMVMLQAKNYAWTGSQTIGDLLPNNSSRFASWTSGTYKGVGYTVTVGDNSDETGTQDFQTDSDGKVFLRVAVAYPSGTRTTQILMSPGSPASTTAGEGPASLPGGIGICYGFLNFLTLMSMNAASTITGTDTVPNGWTGCASAGGCDASADGSTDQYGVATTSWFGTWSLGTYFNFGAANHLGAVTGKTGNLVGGSPPPNNTSYGKPTSQDCANYDNLQTLADNMWAANDPDINKYQKNFGNMTVAGNLVFGTEAVPEVVYIKTGIFGKVIFSGTVSGVGILVADGNVDFNQDVNWNGVIINDANAIGNIMKFKDDTNINGAMMINRPILSAEIGSASLDLNFASGKVSNVIYSSTVLNSILEDLDPNYTPPAGTDPGQALSVASVQDLI